MRLPLLLTVIVLTGLSLPGASALAQTIYTCIDGRGRSITSDRPIAECTDRMQRELSTSGVVKRHVAPVPTAQEQAAQDEKDRQAAEVRAREMDEKRRDRALVQRYPNRELHDQERAAALAQIDEVIKAFSKRKSELAEQRKAIDSEMEFYVKDPSKAPAYLKRKVEENVASAAVQQKFIVNQEQEKRRINLRFDEDLNKLKQLWAMRNAPVYSGGTSAKPGKIN